MDGKRLSCFMASWKTATSLCKTLSIKRLVWVMAAGYILCMKPGDRIIVEVGEVRDNGIFFEYEGKSAIVNVTELTWDETKPAYPSDFATAGDQLEVVGR
jgi:hypothetical protein